jgi:hypothetical protein
MGFDGASVNGVYMLAGCGGLGAHRVRVVAGRGADSDPLFLTDSLSGVKKQRTRGAADTPLNSPTPLPAGPSMHHGELRNTSAAHSPLIARRAADPSTPRDESLRPHTEW